MTAATTLLQWYKRSGRDLPWRKTRDPYHILVSEIMLQQTQVDRVKLFYARWLAEFPDWKQLASASNTQVIHAWAGLGYNRRALMLREIARSIVKNGVPQTQSDWQKLKGIGPYTAAAISAFAQQKRTMPIDTNIRRVLGRLLLGLPYPQLADDEKIQKATEVFLPKRGKFYDVPQALFDLANDACGKIPDCGRCPLRKECKAAEKFLRGNIVAPKQMIKKAVERKHRNKPYPDRIYRGRILKLVREEKSAASDAIGSIVDKTYESSLDQKWVEAMIERLVAEGFLKRKGKKLTL
ncbi:MAG: A/G-specific adenine glycosylase [Patescibacteria group bacterium]